MRTAALSLGLGVVLPLAAPVLGNPIVGGYWPSWASQASPISAVPLPSYDYVAVFVAVPDADGSIDMGGLDQANADAVTAIHAAGKRAILTLGGWTGSCGLWATAASRKAWAKKLATTLKTLKYDGIEIDWEQGGCSTSPGTPSDTANFVAFTQALRSAVGSKPQLTAAVPVAGLPQKISLAKAVGSKALNFMNVMNYDNAAPGWSTLTGANSPIRECAPTGGNAGSAALALSTYAKMGVPASSLTLGTPSYGYLWGTSAIACGSTLTIAGCIGPLSNSTANGYTTSLYQPYDQSCSDPLTGTTILYSDMIAQGYLTPDGSAGANGWRRYYDQCTQTPYLYSPTRRLMITYDDAQSFAAKAVWAKQQGMAGFVLYSTQGDTAKGQLIAAARAPLDGKSRAPTKAKAKKHSSRHRNRARSELGRIGHGRTW